MPAGRVFLKSILATALTLRLLIVLDVLARYPKGWFFRTPGELSFLAQSLLAGHGLSSPFGGSTGPTAFLAPGYPFILATIFRLFGSFTTASAIVTMLIQTAFSILTVYFITRIAAREFGSLAGNIAGFFWAIGLPFLWMPIVLWDTSLSILLITSAIALTLRTMRAPTLGNWAWMGGFGGFALLVNPSLAVMFAALFVWTAYFLKLPSFWRSQNLGSLDHHRRPSALTGPILSAAILLAIFAPWPIRNQRVLHAFIPLRSNLSFELWKGNRPTSTAVDDTSIYPVFNRQEFDAYATQGEVAYMRQKSTLAKEEIAAHPGAFATLTLRRILAYWTGTGSDTPSLLLAAHETLTTLLAVLGLYWLFKTRRFQLAVTLLLPLLLFPLPYYITHAELRFRILIEPVTTLLAAYAVTTLRAPSSRQLYRR